MFEATPQSLQWYVIVSDGSLKDSVLCTLTIPAKSVTSISETFVVDQVHLNIHDRSFSILGSGSYQITWYNAMGHSVAVYQGGAHQEFQLGSEVSAGIYMVRIRNTQHQWTQKVMILP